MNLYAPPLYLPTGPGWHWRRERAAQAGEQDSPESGGPADEVEVLRPAFLEGGVIQPCSKVS